MAAKTKLAFRGRDRQLIRKLKEALELVQKMDTRRAAAADKAKTTAIKFHKAGTVDHTSKITALHTRCKDCLAAKTAAAAIVAEGAPEF